jgi:hypothetical protein
MAQVFKTAEGARKRAAFENAHTKQWHYAVERWLDGQPDNEPVNGWVWHRKRYTWRLRRTRRGP